jgi:hypothetical protein
MEITFQNRLTRTLQRMRLAFWRTVSACFASLMRAPRSLRLVVVAAPLIAIAGFAYWLGCSAGNLIVAYLP